MENSNLSSPYIIGRNSVMEAIKSNHNIEYILVNETINQGSIIPIIYKAKNLGIEIRKVPKRKLDALANKMNHQGIIAVGCAKKYSSIEEILELAKSKNELPFVILCDGIEDPHNLGAIIRSAECAGVHGIVIPKRRSVGLTCTVDKTSAGALEHMLVAKESNITNAIKKLKKNNIWVFGTHQDGEIWCKQNLNIPIALVLGSEGKGISKLAMENCDKIISLPVNGNINSLNVSVSAGIFMYEVIRQRLGNF